MHRADLITYLSKSDKLTERLDVLLKYIDPIYILRDITVLRHTTKYVLKRMKMVEAGGIKSPRPWMVKCLRYRLER